MKGILRQITLQAIFPFSSNMATGTRVLMAIFMPLLLGSCVESKLKRQLGQNAAEQRAALKRLLADVDNEAATPIQWRAAHQKLMSDNLQLRRSRDQLQKARELKSKEWLDLIPDLSTYVNIGANISELSDLESDDINARLAANLRIPNPFLFHARLYGAALQRQNSEWSHELDNRRMYAQLYEAFVEADAIAVTERAMRKQSSGYALLNSSDVLGALERLEHDKAMLHRRKAYHRIKVNQLFNTPGKNWKLEGALPRISYRDRIGDLKLGGEYGKLALNLEAIQLEGAILRVKRIKFQQWPSLNLGLSLPPLYTKNQSNGFSTDEMLLFSSATKSIDLTDVGGLEDVGDAKKRLQITREQLMLSREREVLQLNQLVRRYRELMQKEARLSRDIERIGDYGFTEPQAVLNDLEARSKMQLELVDVRRQLRQLDLQFLIWDETYWKS